MRHGEDAKLERDAQTNVAQHTFEAVYGEMFRQICLDYSCLGDFRALTTDEIRFFYNGLRATLKQRTKR